MISYSNGLPLIICIASIEYIISTLTEYGFRKAEGKTTALIDQNFQTFVDAVMKAPTVPEKLDPLTPIGLAYLCFWQSVKAGVS